MKLPEAMVFDGRDGTKDRTDFYLAALNSHDGSSAFRFILTPVRIVCANTNPAAIVVRRRVSRSATPVAPSRDQRGAVRLKLTWRYVEAFETEAAQLYATPMDVDEARRFAAELVKVDQAESDTARNRRREQASAIVKLFVCSPSVEPIGGTRWASCIIGTEKRYRLTVSKCRPIR